MGVLADIGRSRAISGLTGGILENTQGLIKTRMEMDRMAEESRSREIEDRINTIKLQETEAEIAKRRRPVFLDDFEARYPHPETAKYYSGVLRSGGYTKTLDIGGKQREYFEHGDFTKINELIAKEPERQKGLLSAQIVDIGQQKTSMAEQYQKAVEKGDNEKAQGLKDQFDALKEKEGMLVRSYETLTGKGMTEYQEGLLALRAEAERARQEDRRERTEIAEKRTEIYGTSVENKKEIEEERIKVQREKLRASKASPGSGGKPTAAIQNIEYLVAHGWGRKDAENIILHGKPMSRATFIAQMTKSIYGNEFILDEEKGTKVEQAINFYDSTIGKKTSDKGKEDPLGIR